MRVSVSVSLRALALVVAVAVVTAGVAPASAAPAAAAEQQPIAVGLLIPTSGNFAAPGQYMKEGFELYLKQHDGMLGGRKVVVVQADSGGNPAVGLTQARRLVEQDHVSVIVGPLSTAVDQAIIPYITSHKVPAIFPVLSPDDITQRMPAAYVVRTSAASSQTTQPLGDYAYKTLKYRKIATIAYDFSFGWESVGGFVEAFQHDGGSVLKQLWTPIATSDYGPYLSELPRNIDAVMCSFSGAAAVNFIKQYKAFGLKAPLICQGNTTDESTLPATGPAALGILTALHYSTALDRAQNKSFVAAYTKAYGHQPSYYGEGTYDAALVLAEAVGKLHGDISDTQKFIATMRSLHVTEAPRGPLTFDRYGNPDQNVYIRKVEMSGGRLENVVIGTMSNVSQFWTFDPTAVLQRPVYSRSYPVCNACK